MFYAWQHGQGASKKLPKAEELEQLPGRGSLDFAPMVAALKNTRYSGFRIHLHAPGAARHPDSEFHNRRHPGNQPGPQLPGVARLDRYPLSPIHPAADKEARRLVKLVNGLFDARTPKNLYWTKGRWRPKGSVCPGVRVSRQGSRLKN